MNDIRDAFRRYATLVSERLPLQPVILPFAANSEIPEIPLSLGLAFPFLMKSPGMALSPVISLAEPLLAATAILSDVSVVDRAGHSRPVYRPLLVYSWLQTYRLTYESLPRNVFSRWDEALRVWCDDLETRLGRHSWPARPLAAADGAAIAEMLWAALALHHAGKLFIRDPWTDLAADAFGHLQRRQAAGGSFLTPGGSDNPETWWYHELVVLHAAASFAVATEDRPLAAAVLRATDFHLAETQPDHATHQPWGLFAFAWNPNTRSLADALLHTLAMRPGLEGTAATDKADEDPVALMLLADALYCLRLFVPEENP